MLLDSCGFLDPGCNAQQALEGALTWLGQQITNWLNWLETAILPTVLGHLADGDLTNLCNNGQQHPDCYASDYVIALTPYIMMLGFICWAWSVVRSLHDSSQSDMIELFYHVRRGLLMLGGIALIYPGVRFTYELCRVASNAMTLDIMPNGFQTAGTINPSTGPLGVALTYGAVGTAESIFVTIWMAGITVGTLLGALFGGFAVATTPVSGMRGVFGRWLEAMSGLMLLRLFFPPISAVLMDLMARFVTRPLTANNQPASWSDLPTWIFTIEHVALGVALLWVTGKVAGFLGRGVAAGAGTVSGMMAAPGQAYSGAASTVAAGRALGGNAQSAIAAAGTGAGRAVNATYRGTSRAIGAVTRMATRIR